MKLAKPKCPFAQILMTTKFSISLFLTNFLSLSLSFFV